jgi:hypothetical protein
MYATVLVCLIQKHARLYKRGEMEFHESDCLLFASRFQSSIKELLGRKLFYTETYLHEAV